MLAAADRASPSIVCVVGSAERIPLRDRACDVAWLSQSLHHVRDKTSCAGELCRVVQPTGYVLIRGTFSDQLDGFPTLFKFFPSTRRVCEDLPTVVETAALFEAHGFTLKDNRRIPQQTCDSLREFSARSRLRADTGLTLIPDAEFQSGLRDLEWAVNRGTEPAPIIETLTLLVFRRMP
jgi:SAM-dependent methyltransferase